jgi:hypothetical protein
MPKRPLTSDRIIIALRERLLAQGFIDITKDASGRRRAVWQHGRQYGPLYQPSVPPVRLTIHAGRGRPPAGSIGLVAAVALASGSARFAVHRALAGAPRAGTRRHPQLGCPLCGHAENAVPTRSAGPLPEPDFSAIGLRSVPNTPQRIVDPKAAILGALEEALNAALGAGVLELDAQSTAQTLLARLES